LRSSLCCDIKNGCVTPSIKRSLVGFSQAAKTKQKKKNNKWKVVVQETNI